MTANPTRVALVTGAAKGTGAAIVELCRGGHRASRDIDAAAVGDLAAVVRRLVRPPG